MSTPLCEIRVPTYRRPAFLERALRSLMAQSCPDWTAIVLDDSPDREAEPIVEKLRDGRIQYLWNRSRLGGSGNLDQAFASDAVVDGRYACVLEDDNWLFPEFIADNISALGASRCDVVLRNQAVWRQEADDGWMTDRTTRGQWLEPRIYSPIEMRALLLMFEGISNGGLFWRIGARSDFVVGPEVKDSGLQEYCRTLQLRDSVLFAPEPLAAWAQMPAALITRSASTTFRFRAGQAQLARYLTKRWGQPIVEMAQAAARVACREDLLERRLAYAHPFGTLRHSERRRWALRGLALRAAPRPLSRYFVARSRYLTTLDDLCGSVP